MSEQVEQDERHGRVDEPTAEVAEHPDQPAIQTGHPAVDAVLASLDQLEGRPVSEHVAVFEAAHEALRGALTDHGDRSGDASAS